jgi:hypothetical protein
MKDLRQTGSLQDRKELDESAGCSLKRNSIKSELGLNSPGKFLRRLE